MYFTAAPQHGLLTLFPSMVAELFHPVLCPGRAHLTFQQFFFEEILNYWNLVGDRFFPYCFFFLMGFCAGEVCCSYTAGGRDRNWEHQQASCLRVPYFILDSASSMWLTAQLIVQIETQLKSAAN